MREIRAKKEKWLQTPTKNEQIHGSLKIFSYLCSAFEKDARTSRSTRSMRGEYQRRERYGPDILRWATEGKRSGHRKTDGMHCKLSPRLKNRLAEALIAALTAFITALTMVSCMGFIPAL